MFIFLYGADSYRSAQKLKEIKENFKEKTDPSGINLVTFSGENFDLEKYNNAACQSGFLVTKRLIIVKNLLLNKPNKELTDGLIELISRLKNSDNIFVFWENGEPDQRASFFKFLIKARGMVQNFELLENAKLENWVKKYVADRGGQINASALNMLLSFSGNDLWLITNDLDKLLAYKNNDAITASDVKQFVTAKLHENIFGLSDALAENNKKKAVKLLNEQLAAGLNEIYLLSMITRQFRILTEIKSLLSQSVPASQIAAKLKLHPYVVKKSLIPAQKFTLAKLQNVYQQLIETEKKIKSTSLSQPTLLNLLILQI